MLIGWLYKNKYIVWAIIVIRIKEFLISDLRDLKTD